MLKIKLTRVANNPEGLYCIGRLYMNDVKYCDTLEPFDRGLDKSMPLDKIKSIKVKKHTAIPTGEYNVTMAMSPSKKRKLPLLLDVPGFQGILIHLGNYPRDTEGCILPGENNKVGMVTNSTPYEKRICTLIQNELDNGGKVTISISRNYKI